MDGKKRFLVKEDRLLLQTLVKLTKERLTKKQKQILEFLSKNEDFTSTSLVRELSKELSCSRSTLWNNLNSLKRAGLVENGPNKPVELTSTAVRILEENKEVENERKK